MQSTAEVSQYVGTVTKIVSSYETSSIFRLKTKTEEFTALGKVSGITQGEKLFVKGYWDTHPKFGKQLKVTGWEKIVPTSQENTIDLLSTGLIKGVGAATAKKIVDALGADAIEKILENQNVLQNVKGLGKKADSIAQSIRETYDGLAVTKDLISLGLTPGTANRIYQKMGRSAAKMVTANPYCLTKVDRIGFLKADDIAANLNIKGNSQFRIQAGITHVLHSAMNDEGHTYLPVEELVSRALTILNKNSMQESSRDDVLKALPNDDLVSHEKGISIKWVARFEQEIADHIKRLNHRVDFVDVTEAIKQFESREKITLAEAQKAAVAMVMEYGASILTGGPGVGKTRVVQAIISIFKAIHPDEDIILVAPTGRAARRMAEVTGLIATTIHKALGISYNGKPVHDRSNPLKCRLLIIDETSMMGIILFRQLLNAVGDNTIVLLVGDPDQLPSIEPGNVLRDLLKSNIPSVRLTEIFRQAAESQIVTSAHSINKGELLAIDRSKTDFFFVEREEPEAVQKSVLYYLQKLGYDLMDVQVLCPMKTGAVGTIELNRLIQDTVNKGTGQFRTGDKVIQTRNDNKKHVYNGDMGLIKRTGSTLSVKYNGDLTHYLPNEVKDIDLAYAVTIHKSQGSEYKAVIIVLTMQHFPMLARNLLYTAITRAKEKVVLIGTKKALAIAIKNNKPVQRYTLLADLISQSKI